MTMTDVPFTRVAQSLPASVPFVGPETMERARGAPFKARIGANESALGPSPRVRAAMIEAIEAGDPRLYCDPENHELRTALARRHGVALDEVVVDAGIDTLLGVTVRLFMEQEDIAITSAGAYPTFAYQVSGFGGKLVTVPYRQQFEDPAALLAAACERATTAGGSSASLGIPNASRSNDGGSSHVRPGRVRLVYLANPDNPMGTRVSPAAVTTLVDGLPPGCLLLLDEAYVDYTDETADPVNPIIDTSDPRVIRFRTFSKAWGMAGMRIGYAIAHRDVIAGFERVRNHFGVNRLAQIAALASLEDDSYLEHVRESVRSGRQRIEVLADSHGLPWVPSATNFVAVDLGSAARADSVMVHLLERGVFVRKPAVAPLNVHVRIGIGSEEEHALLETAFAAAFESGVV